DRRSHSCGYSWDHRSHSHHCRSWDCRSRSCRHSRDRRSVPEDIERGHILHEGEVFR
ncbi:18765_t:CDS:1, partial [Funneliformis geosporum]